MRVMGSLGDFIFSVYSDTAFSQLTRTSDGGWVSTDRAGQEPGSQNTGPGLDTIQIRGVVFGGSGQSTVAKLRGMQKTKQPQALLNGSGDYLGLWRINRITETQSRLVDNGNSLKTQYTLELEKYEP